MGTGIYVHQQFRPQDLVKGDTFMDADYGDMVWDGRKWISEDDYSKREWMRIGRRYFKYAAVSVFNKTKPIALLEYLIKYYHHPKRNHRK